jgi:hypothetical protein
MLLFLLAVQDSERRLKRSVQRARLPRGTLRRLWMRERFTDDFLQEVGSWLLNSGWVLIDAGSTFGAVRADGIRNWPRISANNLESTIKKVRNGEFGAEEFAKLEEAVVDITETDENEEEE